MALAMIETLPQNQQTFTIMLWHTWTWETLRRGQANKALQLLLTCADEKVDKVVLSRANFELLSPSPAELLKAQRVSVHNLVVKSTNQL